MGEGFFPVGSRFHIGIGVCHAFAAMDMLRLLADQNFLAVKAPAAVIMLMRIRIFHAAAEHRFLRPFFQTADQLPGFVEAFFPMAVTLQGLVAAIAVLVGLSFLQGAGQASFRIHAEIVMAVDGPGHAAVQEFIFPDLVAAFPMDMIINAAEGFDINGDGRQDQRVSRAEHHEHGHGPYDPLPPAFFFVVLIQFICCCQQFFLHRLTSFPAAELLLIYIEDQVTGPRASRGHTR